MTEESKTAAAIVYRDTVIARDGVELAVHRMEGAPGGADRTVVLLHGLFSSAQMNWIKYGHAGRLAEAGFSVIMPDLRAHGESGAPHDPANYPPAVLVDDLDDVIGHYSLTDYDLGGFSLGSRTVLGGVVNGLNPRRLMLVGMGLEGLLSFNRRADWFIDAIDNFDDVKRGDEAYFAVSFMKTMKVDRVAARLLLSSRINLTEADLKIPAMPVLVLCGTEDRDNGSPTALVEALPDGHYATMPGTHMSSVVEKALGLEMIKFLK